MKRKLIAYPKTKQFNGVIRDISTSVAYVGQDDDGEPIYDGTREKPTILFKGSVKLHGTNASVCYDGTDVWVQSRNKVIESMNGHEGFAQFVHNNKDFFIEMFKKIHIDGLITTIYGEWTGPGIQKGVAISEIDNKMFFVFGAKLRPPEGDSKWTTYEVPKGNDRVWDIKFFDTYELEIDFEMPALSVVHLAEITKKVEEECPVAKVFGISGIGEGVVWTGFYKGNRHIFKVKGQKHSVSKVKKLAEVDPEKMNSIYEFVDYAVTQNRVEQAMWEVRMDSGEEALTKKDTAAVLRWMANDIISEEVIMFEKSQLEWKDVARECSDRTRRIFFNEIDKV